MKKINAYLILSLIFVVVFGYAIAGYAEAEYVAKIAHSHNEDGLYYKATVKFQEVVEAASNGKIKIDHYPHGQLGSDRDIQEGVQIGTVTMGFSSSPIVLLDDYFKILDAPYLFINREHISAVLDGAIGQKLAARLVDKGIRHLAYCENGFRQITNNTRPIFEPEDLAGIKLRTPESPVRMKTFKTFGANPVPMSFTELFGALQQGVVDGQENPLTAIYQASFSEVQNYLSITNHVYSPVHFICNESWYQSLPADLKIVVLLAADQAAVYTRMLGAENDAKLISILKDQGMAINNANVASFVDMAKPIWNNIAEEVGGEAGELIRKIAEMGEQYK